MNIKVIPERPRYGISKCGQVFALYKRRTDTLLDIPRPVKAVVDNTGYPVVCLFQKDLPKRNFSIHRLLANAFIPNPKNLPHVNHKDGNKQNNCLTNLEWCTEKENAEHATQTGLIDPRTKKLSKVILQIDQDTGQVIQEFCSSQEAGRQTGIAVQNIGKAALGKRKSAGGYGWKYK